MQMVLSAILSRLSCVLGNFIRPLTPWCQTFY